MTYIELLAGVVNSDKLTPNQKYKKLCEYIKLIEERENKKKGKKTESDGK